MSDWKRSTREITFEQLPSEMKEEIQTHIALYNLGDIPSDALMCIQTDSEKAKRGLFGFAEVVHYGAIVTPRWLIWVVSRTNRPASVLSALLADIIVQDYAATPYAKMVPDSGIEVNGKFTDVSENISAFIGFEENAAGKKFKDLVMNMVQTAKK